MKRVNACFVIKFYYDRRSVCEFKINMAKYETFLRAHEYSCSDFTECYFIHMQSNDSRRQSAYFLRDNEMSLHDSTRRCSIVMHLQSRLLGRRNIQHERLARVRATAA